VSKVACLRRQELAKRHFAGLNFLSVMLEIYTDDELSNQLINLKYFFPKLFRQNVKSKKTSSIMEKFQIL
jgi:hypothetical protein